MGTKNRHRKNYSQNSPSSRRRYRATRTLSGERIGEARLNELLNKPTIQGDTSSNHEGSSANMGSNSMAEALQKAEDLFKPAPGQQAPDNKPDFQGNTRFKRGVTINGEKPNIDNTSGNDNKMAAKKRTVRRFTEEQQVVILKDADEIGATKAAKKHGVVSSLIYQWRAKRKKIDEAGGPVTRKTAKIRKPDGEPTKLSIPSNGAGPTEFDLQIRDEEISFLSRKNKLLEAELARLRHDQ